jgi:hypothetical protein
MNWNLLTGRTATLDHTPAKPERTHLRAMIAHATGDSLDSSDEHAGLLSTIREEVVCPFPARLAGEDVECVRLEWPKTGYGLNAVCKSNARTQVVDISMLEFVPPLPQGHEWIEAFFAWRDFIS